MNRQQLITLTLFGVCYVYLCVGRKWKAPVVWAFALAFIALGFIPLRSALAAINLNVLGTFTGTFVVAQLFATSGVPLLLARGIVSRSNHTGAAIILVCIFGGFVSAWVDNVATILIVAPVAFAMADHLGVDPAPFLIGLTLSTNLQGSATLIGDAPSMILAGFTGMSFNDFFWMQGRPGLFFAVQVGAAASVLALAALFHRYRDKPEGFPPVRVTSWLPAGLLLGIVAALATLNLAGVRFPYKAGVTCMAAATVGLLWFYARNARAIGIAGVFSHARRKAAGFDWNTVFLLAGLFVVVATLGEVGLIDEIATAVRAVTGGRLLPTFLAVVWISVILSGFIDNIPYVTALVPVVISLGKSMGSSPREVSLLLFGLLIGATVGGNITPIGASANVVAVRMLEKRGHHVGFGRFMRIGVPFTLLAVTASIAFLWVFWKLIP